MSSCIGQTSYLTNAALRLTALLAAAALQRTLAASLAQHLIDVPSFASFVDLYGRAYEEGSAEYEERRALYEQRVDQVLHHNSKVERRWTAGINSLADRTSAELRALRGWKRTALLDDQLALAQVDRSHPKPRSKKLPKQVIWSFLNSSSKQWEQGGCGSCWAIATVELLEMHNELYPVKKRSFSAQDLVSCVENPHHCGGKGKCDGATIELAFEHVMKHGIANEDEVPYEGIDGTCRKDFSSFLEVDARPQRGLRSASAKKEHAASQLDGMTGFRRLPSNQYMPLMHALLDGPVGVAVAADDWSLYKDGIFECTNKDAIIDHAVVLLGFGKDDKVKYWLLKNSWGEDWGVNGNIKLLRRDHGKDNEGTWCGIDSKPEVGNGCDGGPSEVEVCGSCGILYDSVIPRFRGKVSDSLRQKASGASADDDSSAGSWFW